MGVLSCIVFGNILTVLDKLICIFEKLILNRINEIEAEKKVDLTGDSQHRLKKGRSTLTSGLAIQSALAKALDQGNFVLMASLNLSSAFDLVN